MTQQQEHWRDAASRKAAPRRRSFAILLLLAACAALAFSGFVALGTWQLYRLQWKLALIERVEQRVHAAPIEAPGPDRWPHITAASDEYHHVRVSGIFLHELSTRVQATTELGGGYWLLTPLRRADGSTILINRGFIPVQLTDRGLPAHRNETRDAHDEERNAASQNTAHGGAAIVVTGLLRMSEPGGAFLRSNDPANDRWFSRDVRAIAAARGLTNVAPYFVDADAAPAGEAPADSSPERPVGGLTVISFHNNHLVYALTWYALALMVAGACLWVVREERKKLRSAGASADSDDWENENGRKN